MKKSNNVKDRLTPEEVAMLESMNRGYYHAPKVKHLYQKIEPRKRTKREEHLYMINKIYMKNYQIRNAEREIKEIKLNHKCESSGKIELLKLRIKKLEKLLSLIVVPEYKREILIGEIESD